MTRIRVLALVLASSALLALAASFEHFHFLRTRLAWLAGEEATPCAFRLRHGVPCLGCGGTHAFCEATRGHLARAFRAHPAGAMLGLWAWGVALASGASLVTGRGRYLLAAGLAGLLLVAASFVFHAFVWWRALPPGVLHS